MIFLDELKPLTLYKKPFHLPIEEKDKKKGSAVLLLTPDYESSLGIMKNPLLVNNKYFESYYLEKDITYFINQEGYLEDISDTSYRNVINETRRFSNKIDGEIIEDSFVKSDEHPLFQYLSSNNEYEEILETAGVDLFFLSETNMDNKTLQPRVPDNFLTKNGYEDNKTKRVCLSTSISKCLTALSMNCKGKYYYVHSPSGEHDTYKPSLKEVPDRNITGEIWIKEPVKIQCIGKIFVSSDDGKPGKKYKYGDNKEAELYGWDYKWDSHYDITNEASDEVLTDPKRHMKSLKLKMNKAKYALNKLSDNDRNTVGVASVNPNPGAAAGATITDPIKPDDIVKESCVYKTDTMCYYRNNVKTAFVEEDIEKGSVIDVLDSELGRSILGPGRDGWNVELVDNKFIATEKIYKGSMLFCHGVQNKPVNESTEISSESSYKSKIIDETYIGATHLEYILEDTHMRCKTPNGDVIFAFNENLDEEVLNEANVSSTMLTKLLYKERFKNNKEVFEIYDRVKVDLPWITRTFLEYERYKQFNLFVDLSYYNKTFFSNNVYKMDKGVDLYFEFINRFINDKRLDKNGYTKRTVFVPVSDWSKPELSIYKFSDDINPISTIVRLMRSNTTALQKWKGIEFVFMTNHGYFKLDLSDLATADITKFISLIEKLKKGEPIVDLDIDKESKRSIVANIVSKVEDSQKIKVNNLTGNSEEINKDELIKKIDNAASTSTNTNDTIDTLEEDNYIKSILANLSAEEDNSSKINQSRLSRMNKLNDEFLNKKLKNVSVRDMLSPTGNDKELPVTKVEVDTVNPEWENLQYINFETSYDIQEDILASLYSLSDKTSPISIRDIKIEDSSTSEDLIETYTVQLEDINGERFTLKFDVPKFKDNKFMRLRGNDKTINGQLTQIPITKTDDDTVQVVSNYKKIFIKRYGTSLGKSFVITDKILKALKKMESKEIKITTGDNSRICNKYDLPIDYIDISALYSKLETRDCIVFFNQDEIRDSYKIDDGKGIPIAVNKSDDSILYYDSYVNSTFSELLYAILSLNNNEFNELYNKASVSTRYTYSKASILNNDIPVVVIMGYNEGLTKALKKAKISYNFEEKRPSINKNYQDVIKFNDGYLVYDLDYNSSMLINGLKQCNTEDYSIGDINGKSMWLDFLDLFGGKILADGLDNFYDMMIDPITKEVLEHYNLPTDYIEILAYSNNLLTDNKYSRHTDMNARRYRSNELVAGYVYQSIADSYGRYRTDLKRNKKAKMSMKQSEVLDKVLLDPTASDLSILNPLLEIEAINSVTYKGLVGMNADRAYGLDKRTYDESMINLLGLSTGFAGNVGITRQATLDMNISGKRGYIKVSSDPDNMSITKTFTATEALTPFGSRRDDPFRSAMTFIQTSKHGMRVKKAMPSLITNGADQALPYMITDTFAFKSKQDGKVIEKSDSHIIIKYKDGTNELVDLRERVQKNSDGGFYVTLKLDTDLKLNSSVKKGQVVAYDKSSFSDVTGHTDDLSFNVGTLAKIAIMNTDEGFEDSAIISDWLSDALSSEIVVKKEVMLPKNTNIYNMVKIGQQIQEGDKLMVFQNAFEEEDVNILLKNLVDDEDMISDLGRIPIKSKVTGSIEDIKIYRTVEKDELSDSLKKKVNELEKPISDMIKVMKKYNIDYSDMTESNYKLNSTGKLKNVDEGVLIEFYLKYEDKMSIGDKIVYYSALKGVVKDIFPVGKEPYTDFRKDEKIHSLLSLGSVNGRMVGSPQIVGSINKVLIELDRKIKGMLGLPFKNIDED